jgi:hypothetical protein
MSPAARLAEASKGGVFAAGRNALQLVQRCPCAVQIALCPGAACARMRTSNAAAPLGAVLDRQPPEVAFRELGRALLIVPIEGDRGAAKRRDWMSAAAIEQRGGFVEAALTARSSPRRARPSVVMPGRQRASSSHALVSSRSASSHAPRHMQTGRVLRAAHGKERLQPPFAAVLLDALAPLHGAAMIAGAIAGADQIAAGERDQQTIGQARRRGLRRSPRPAHGVLR